MKKEDISKLSDAELPPQKEDFRKTFQWRIFRIMAEFIEGFEFVAGNNKKSITVFGSSRLKEDSPGYIKARRFGNLLAEEGFSVVTGGGPGIMEAANRGVYEKKGESIGINIQLVEGERANSYMNRSIAFYYFFTRKVMLSFSSVGYVYFPGGFGTLDELFEMVTLLQTKKIPEPICILVVGRDFWEPALNWFQETLLEKHATISQEDLDIIEIVDTPEEAIEIIKKRFKEKQK